MIGKTLGQYQVLEKIGEGGMGEVYRARDTTLDRDAALKVLPAHLMADPERLTRFEREAKVLASLNHSGIAAIYGFHEQDGVRFLAMELVPGLDLSQRIAQGPLPLDEALPLAARIAEAMEYAHERNIVHRDLKPANIKLAGGSVKVLDFGLAKAFAPEGAAGAPTSTPTILPTVTTGGTRSGVILGTAAYMSPEQARGLAVDRRTDIWAFGCILYEMLTGKLLFAGSTVTDTLAAVLRADIDLSALPEATPAAVKHLLERCLDRDPSTRLRDIGEARVVLADPTATSAIRIVTGGDAPSRRASRPWWPVAAIGAVALGVGLFGGRLLVKPAPAPKVPAVLFEVQDSTGASVLGSLALSPDGAHLVYARATADGSQELALRRLDQSESQTLSGTRGGRQPFWSADGTRIGFFSGNALYQVGMDGSSASLITSIPLEPMGGTWNAEDAILVGTRTGPIYRVAASGGSPVQETTVEAGVEDGHVWPAFLPDGKHYVFLTDASTDEGHRLTLRALGGGESKILRTDIRSAILVDPAGALIYSHNNQLFAFPFDFRKRAFLGSQILVEDALLPFGDRHELPATISSTGILAFQRGNDSSVIRRIPLDGSPGELLTAPDRYRNPRISRDGKRIAFEIQSSGLDRVLWVQDIDRGTRSLISQLGSNADSPVWSADGEWIYFDSDVSGKWVLYRKRVFGGAPPESLGIPENATDLATLDVSRDGRRIFVSGSVPGNGYDMFLGEVGEKGIRWSGWLGTAANEEFGRMSPDGRWVAFTSDATGQNEVYVAPVEGGPSVRQWMFSVGGGSDAAWSPDGTRLYYRDPAGTLTEIVLTVSGDRIETAPPRKLFRLRVPTVGYLRNVYDPTPDGTSVIAFTELSESRPTIRVRTGWRTW